MTDNLAAAAYLIAKGLVVRPLFPAGPDGYCTCGWRGCDGYSWDQHAAGKHPRPSPRGGAPHGLGWWKAHPDDGAGISRRESGIVTVEDDGQLCQWRRSAGVDLPLTTMILASPAGRLRLFYRLPTGFTRTRLHSWPDGWAVDIMATGAAPGPGVTNRCGTYRVARDLPVADAPPSLVRWLESR